MNKEQVESILGPQSNEPIQILTMPEVLFKGESVSHWNNERCTIWILFQSGVAKAGVCDESERLADQPLGVWKTMRKWIKDCTGW
jgi:hypothetical protein